MTDLAIIAHCGACTTYFDNSFEALQLAVQEGADAVELDLRRCADGAVVILHDATTWRVCGAGGTLAELTLAEVQALRGPQGERVATLAEALALPLPIIHEFKEAGIEEELLAALLDRPDDIVSSFDPAVLDRCRAINPSVKRGWLWFGPDWAAEIAKAVENGAYAFHPSNYDVCPEMVVQAKACGLRVNVWSVGDAARAAQLLSWGVDGIMTYGPAATRAAIAAHEGATR
jgi:glycerophosphoryl diester phosphodiesterase